VTELLSPQWLEQVRALVRGIIPVAAGRDADLAEVLTIAQNRTAAQVASAQFWATVGAGATSFGYWSQVAADARRAAHLL
jgi:hypothetical protein